MNQPENLFDVIVVGSGNGGMTAAITAKLSGAARVLVIEKCDTFGGTSGLSGGRIDLGLCSVGAVGDPNERTKTLTKAGGVNHDGAVVFLHAR